MPEIATDGTACIRLAESARSRARPRTARACVAALVLLMLASSALMGLAAFRGPFAPSPLEPARAAPTVADLGDPARYATLWPFSGDSIWNLPIGEGARYVPANISKAQDWGMTVDQDVIILTPDAPRTKVYFNDDAWNGGSRCDVEGGTLFEAPIPEDFVVPAARPGWTPNFATAILAGDNRTLIQGQPMARCSADASPTMWWSQTQEDLYGTGHSGGHGGSMMSSIGGTIRSGELVPGSAIRHAMKVNLDGWANLYWDNKTGGYRWPALADDSCAEQCYRGKNPALRMGSLLALPPSIDIDSMGLETEPARIVAQAFQDYGGYVVDNTGWSVYALSTEYSPQNGWLEDEFEQAWGFPIDPSSRDNPWSRDMDRIFLALHVVDNWDAASWDTVRASNGTLGAGGGDARVSWAPDFSGAIPPPDLTPPVTLANLSGTPGPAPWYVSPVSVTLTASDDRSGVSRIHIRVDEGAWSGYFGPVTVSGEGRHKVEFYTTDIAGNDGAVEQVEFAIDATPPRTLATLTGTLGGEGWYRGPVSVALRATDGGSGVAAIEVRTDGGDWSPYVAPVAVSADGRHTVEYRATDAVGNVETASQVSFLIDTQAAPVAHAITGTLGSSGWYVSTVSVSLGPVGAPGSLKSIAYAVDGSWGTYAGPFVVGDGGHTISYQARYAMGNLGPVESFTIQVDSTAPTVTIEDPWAAIPPDGTISWMGTDAGSGIVGYEISLDGGAFVPVGSATSASGPWSLGPHVLVVRAFDVAGHSATATLRFRVDLDAPRITPKVPAVGDHQGLDVLRVLIVLGTICTILALLLAAPLRRHVSRGAAPEAKGPVTGPIATPPVIESAKGPESPPTEGATEPPKEATAEPPREPPVEPPGEPSKEPPQGPPQEPPKEPQEGLPQEVPREPVPEPPEGPKLEAENPFAIWAHIYHASFADGERWDVTGVALAPTQGPPEVPPEKGVEEPLPPPAVPFESTTPIVEATSAVAPPPIRYASIEYLMETPLEP